MSPPIDSSNSAGPSSRPNGTAGAGASTLDHGAHEDVSHEDMPHEDLAVAQDPLRFPCRSCGAKLTFVPGAAALQCEYCGYKEEIDRGDGAVLEHDLDRALSTAQAAAQGGLGIDRPTYQCEACGAKTSVEAHITAFQCAFCGSDKVTKASATASMRPESVLPFQIPAEEAGRAFSRWIAKLWFRPSPLAKLARAGRLLGVYLPYWTYDALTHSRWNAESGTYYYVNETYRDSSGKSQTRRVQKVRWRPVSGVYDEFFDDVQECGSPSVQRKLLLRIQPFNTQALVPYKPDYLSGFAAEDYRDDVKTCWPRARQQMDDRIRAAIVRRIPGDTHRNLRIQTTYHNRTFKLALLPVWAGAYHYAGKIWAYVVSGQTGRVAGEAPLSWAKVSAAILAVLLLGYGIYRVAQ